MYKGPRHAVKVNKVATFHKLLTEFERVYSIETSISKVYKNRLIL